MRYTVTAAGLGVLRLNETDTVTAVLQNIALILSTPQGSVPLYRDFGLPWDFLDKPRPVAEVMLRAAVKQAIERWEPRAKVTAVSVSEDPARPGRLVPAVTVEIREE